MRSSFVDTLLTESWTDSGPEIVHRLEAAGIRTIVAAGTDTHGLLRGKRIPVGRLPGVIEHGVPLCEVIWALPPNEREPVQRPPGFAGWFPGEGYPDMVAKPDATTLRRVGWEDGAALVLCDFADADGTPISLCPRSILRGVVARAEKLGLEPVVGVELECYVLQESPGSVVAKRPDELVPLDPAPRVYGVSACHALERFARRLHECLAALDIPVEACHPEAGPGQLEINIGNAPAVEAADRAVLLKHAAKALAADEGLVATFMAKPRSDWPGNSCHLHLSVRRCGRDAFHDPNLAHGISPTMRSFIAGTLSRMAELTAVMAPTPNSYRRYAPYSWASTTATWGVDNRSAGLRAVCDGENRTRVEHRQAGGDANPYLAIAAALATGLDGVQRRHPAPPPADGDLYAAGTVLPTLPRTLEDAARLLECSEVASDWLGADFVAHFVAMRRAELAAQAAAVTDWEISRYLMAL